MLSKQEKRLNEENWWPGQKNLSGTDFHASPEGVRRMYAPNNLTARQFN